MSITPFLNDFYDFGQILHKSYTGKDEINARLLYINIEISIFILHIDIPSTG
jgi:hypothetical protein